jgi:WD40 repeat protein
VTTATDHLAIVWNVADKPQQRCVLKGHEGWVNEAAFHPHADILMTASRSENRTRLWDPWRGTPLVTFEWYARGISGDGRRLLGTQGGQLASWPLATSRITRRLHAASPEWPAIRGQMSDDGQLLLTYGWEEFRIWDFRGGEELVHQPLPGVLCASLTPGAEHVVTSSDSGVQRWPFRRGDAEGWQLGPPDRLALPSPMECIQRLDCRPNGTLAIAGHGLAFVVDSGWQEKGPVVSHADADRCSLSPDGRWMATFGTGAQGVRVWEAATGHLACRLYTTGTNAVATFSPCGRWLFAGAGDDYGFWSVGRWTFVCTADTVDRPVVSAAFSADSRWLAATDRGRQLRILDVASGRELVTLPTEHHAASACFSPDDSELICLNQRTGVRVWNLTQLRKELAELGLDWRADN